ncbi:MAG: ECF-type sigma factor [Planctomycetota bacterium]
MTEITQLLNNLPSGFTSKQEGTLIEAIYQELKQIARFHLVGEIAHHSLDATALVNEAFLRLFGGSVEACWENRSHFYGAAAEAMRRILVDHARKKNAKKRKADLVELKRAQDTAGSAELNLSEILDVHDVLELFEQEHPKKARLVKLRYFAGLTIPQAAEVMQISEATANRHWAFSRAWLYQRIHAE